jgi:FMN phosphatase YigB (HAD superfamily)
MENQINTLIFDLSEVFISGLLGFEKPLAQVLGCAESDIESSFGGELLQRLFWGQIDEDAYLMAVRARGGWNTPIAPIKEVIRANFHTVYPGVEALFERLRQTGRYYTVLLSDHAVEWVDYIYGVHSILQRFDEVIFSYHIQHTKRMPETFPLVLARIGRRPEECFFVDDSARNVANAAAAGIAGRQFISAPLLERDLLDLGLL